MKSRLFTILLSLYWFSAFPVVSAGTPAPPNFDLIVESKGVKLFKNNNVFVQVIDYKNGGRLKLFIADKKNPLEDNSDCSNDPLLHRKSITDYYEELNREHSDLFSVVNGTFFSTTEYPTPLAFSVKIDGEIVSCGYESKFPNDMLLFEDGQSRTISKASLSRNRIKDNPNAVNVIGGLSNHAIFSGVTARTYLGVADNDIVLILSSSASTQSEAEQILLDFGVDKDKIMMLDGGGSTQFLHKGGAGISTTRKIPQVIAVLSGKETGESITPTGKLFLKPTQVYATEGSNRGNLNVRFDISNESNINTEVSDSAIAVLKDGKFLFDCWVNGRATTINGKQSVNEGYQVCNIYNSGNYTIEGRVKINKDWLTICSENITVQEEPTFPDAYSPATAQEVVATWIKEK